MKIKCIERRSTYSMELDQRGDTLWLYLRGE
jgi:hypothetical protein